MKKFVYLFGNGKAEGKGNMKDLLGGKGAGLAEMTRIGVPVPPGFTISTEACTEFYNHKRHIPENILKEIELNLSKLEKLIGKKLGDPENPLLVSVRSGAKFSMPGMMDTILNLGLNDRIAERLSKKTDNPIFVWDAYRRLIEMFSDVVFGIDKEEFEHLFADIKKKEGVKSDSGLTPGILKQVIDKSKQLVKKKANEEFPQGPLDQLHMAIRAVFLSWNNERAIFYRKQYGIPDDLGTAANVQAMVFGNMSDDSGTGVGFTRDPASGERNLYAECLMNAQGEDLVAGIRTPKHIEELERELPSVYKQLVKIADALEKHFKDMQDFEFTIERGKLYFLQTRNGKRTGIAALKIAYDMVREKLITREEAISRIEPEHLEQFLFPIFNPEEKEKHKIIATGLAASPGAVSGAVALDADTAVRFSSEGKNTILVRKETSADDIKGMAASKGVLTARGGRTSHAAVVGRQMGKVCIVGAEDINIDEKNRRFVTGDVIVKEGDFISLDGFEGKVYSGHVPVIPSDIIQVVEEKIKPEESENYKIFNSILKWADEIRTIGVRTNADTPQDARIAYKFGAEGIGLCRTEHMFFAKDRIPIMQDMILSQTPEERAKYLSKLLPMQRNDFKELFRNMKGHPVTIRLIDPPLHEFLPKLQELMMDIKELEMKKPSSKGLDRKKLLLERVQELHEFNPMLGLRGCRLGILIPEITKMQVTAIMEAASEVADEGVKAVPEIMVPLVAMVTEMKAQKDVIQQVADEVLSKSRKKIKYKIGTMIEVPRAAVTADQIATEAEFFSFGTNDLTQMMFGLSRDDSGKIIKTYMNEKVALNGKDISILEKDPFLTLDLGVVELMKLAIAKGRKVRPDLKVGICGEHGGDPQSIEYSNAIGVDYVSCSPFRVPIARLAAAKGALNEK
ncbi:MAG: pyruvate, phosphate dikinase [Thermodesulfobacteriota bacterium]